MSRECKKKSCYLHVAAGFSADDQISQGMHAQRRGKLVKWA